MQVNLNCTGNTVKDAFCLISLPEGGEGYLYLHFEGKEGFFGTIEKTSDLKRLKKMIDKILIHNSLKEKR